MAVGRKKPDKPVVAGIHSPRPRLFKGEESEQNSPSLLQEALFPRGLPTLPRCLSSSTGAAFQPVFPGGGVHCPLLNRHRRGDSPAAPAKPGPYCPGSFPICNGSHRRVWHMPGCRLQRLAARRFNDLQPILFPRHQAGKYAIPGVPFPLPSPPCHGRALLCRTSY